MIAFNEPSKDELAGVKKKSYDVLDMDQDDKACELNLNELSIDDINHIQ